MASPETHQALSKLMSDLASDAKIKYPVEAAECQAKSLESLRVCTALQAAGVKGAVTYGFTLPDATGARLNYEISADQEGNAYKNGAGDSCGVFVTESKLKSKDGVPVKPAPDPEVVRLQLCVLPD